jgi:hypothetical protein
LTKNTIKCSRKASFESYSNAIAESVNAILKQEFIGFDRNIKISRMRELAKNSVKIYNQLRTHYSFHFKNTANNTSTKANKKL